MRKFTRLLNDRKDALQSKTWLRPVLLAIDFVLLIAGLFISPVLGLLFGLIFIILNEWLTPVIVRRIFFKELSGKVTMTGKLKTKVIRKPVQDDGESNDG